MYLILSLHSTGKCTWKLAIFIFSRTVLGNNKSYTGIYGKKESREYFDTFLLYFVVLVFSSIFICSACIFIFRTAYWLWGSFEILNRYAVQYVLTHICMYVCIEFSGSFLYESLPVSPGKKSLKVSCCQMLFCPITY